MRGIRTPAIRHPPSLPHNGTVKVFRRGAHGNPEAPPIGGDSGEPRVLSHHRRRLRLRGRLRHRVPFMVCAGHSQLPGPPSLGAEKGVGMP